MTAQPADVFETLKKLRYDLTAAQAKVTDALNLLAQLNLPAQDEIKCRHCGLRFRGQLSHAEHLHVSHQGPLPAHWLEAERLAGIDSPVIVAAPAQTLTTQQPRTEAG